MNLALREKFAFRDICQEWLNKFFLQFPHRDFQRAVLKSLDTLLCYRDDFKGEPAAWAGGLVYVMSRHDWNSMHPVVLNRELEEVFGVSMSTIRHRADQIWSWSCDDDFDIMPWREQPLACR